MSPEIRQAVASTKAKLADHEAGRGADSTAAATLEAGLACRVDGPGGWHVRTDMPASLGGDAGAPSPGWLMRAAWAACEATAIALRAAELGIHIERIEVVTETESDVRGLLGVDDGVPPGPLGGRVRVRIAARDADPDVLRELVDWADRHSPVTDALRRPVPTTFEFEHLPVSETVT